ncbi:hypothetical protein Tco_1033615 [Tanacetum coccineum]
MNVFVRISFDSTIKLVSFDESQVVTFKGKFVYGIRNGDCGTGSRSDNTVGIPHGFVIHEIEVLKGNEKVTEVIDVENWHVDNSWLLRWIVSLFEWNSSISSMKSSIHSTFRLLDLPLVEKLERQGLIHVDELQHVVVMELMEVGMAVEDLDDGYATNEVGLDIFQLTLYGRFHLL